MQDRELNGGINECTYIIWITECLNVWMEVHVDGWMNVWINGSLGGWML